ncbi:Ig-like domain-containing protein [Ruminiclostridium sufflavum DSM 19573]|uniref:Ig-like domain-containing protein n=1 Tax=Ruminiclostridium sufflavum DSM 19573 TaxID=1121337 RepID=A0A318XJI2_9FIRM|nr:Ig-like domain-containing protein [Ruminiclostridium sufflavum]PYG87154.1 Ig-like domain-containing protein [Ruminiclostridium sufflavum DSM 19573]
MRNFKKISAVAVALAMTVTSMVPAFADTITPANGDKAIVLNTLDLYAGISTDTFDPALEAGLTRGQGAILLTKLFNMDDAAMAMTDAQANAVLKNFKDAATVSTSAKKRLAYLVEQGIMSGSVEANGLYLNDGENLKGGQFATLILKQMGFDVEHWYDAIDQLSEVEGAEGIAAYLAYEKQGLLRDHAVGIMYGALKAEYENGLATIIEKIVESKPEIKEAAEKAGLIAAPVTAEVAVESIKALNTKQIEVVFNQAMNEDSAENENFYKIYNNGSTSAMTLGADSAVLGADGKTVTITLDNAVTDKLTNSSKAKVVVNKDIKAANGKKLAKEITISDIAVEDGIIPSVVKAEATGEYNIKLTFSEPVYGGSAAALSNSNFKVMSGTYQYYVQKAELNNNVINLTLGTKLIEGPVVVTVNEAGVTAEGAIRDYADYKVFKSNTTFDYVKDTSVAVVTVSEAKPTSVKLSFSKPVKGTDIKLYHSVKGAAAYLSTASTNGKYVDSITFTYADASRVPAGNVKFFLVNSDDEDSYKLVDGYGVKVPDQTLTAEVVVDVTAPSLSSSSFDTNKYVTLTFDEELDKSEAEDEENYTFKKVSDGDTVYFNAEYENAADDEYTVRLTPTSYLEDNTEYEVTVLKAEDESGNETDKNIVYTFTTGDNTTPYVKDGTGDDAGNDTSCYAVNADGKIYITFSEAMNEAQMLDLDNYMVDIKNGKGFVALDSDVDKITKISDRKILIDLDAKIAEGVTPDVKVAPIMDLAGKRINGSVDSSIVANIGVEAVKVTSAELISKNKVKVTFNTQLSAFSNTDIVFTGVTEGAIRTQSVESMVTNDDGNTEIILILDKDLETNVKYEGAAVTAKTAADTESESISGTVLGANQQNIAIEDKTAPEIVTFDHDANSNTDKVASVKLDAGTPLYEANNKVDKGTEGTISIKFSEAIKTATLSTLTFNVKGYTVTGISNADDASVVVLSVKADANNTAKRTSVTQVFNITDDAGNVFASGSTWTVR